MPLPYTYALNEEGTLPIAVKDAKAYLKIENDAELAIIQNLIATVVQYAERYTGKDMRAKTWQLTYDGFEDRTLLRKSQVASITSVKYTVSGALVTIADTVYYLKKGQQFSEVLLQDDESWPTDMDEVESGIQIIFVTETPRYLAQYKIGMFEHLAFLYQNRGDCDVNSAAIKSGATEKYGQGRIQRI